jgi:predicted DsbA family dithiol-disulfide isomerase
MRIDFVSDVSCPWCAIGLKSLDKALERLHGEVTVDMHFQPFELNPGMGPEGQDIFEHITEKYGSTAAQQEQSREAIRQRGGCGRLHLRHGKARPHLQHLRCAPPAALGRRAGAPARAQGKAVRSLFHQGEDPSSHELLLRVAGEAGLDVAAAREVLESKAYADEVRQLEYYWQRAGIRSVPAIVINQRHLISGGQPPEVFEQALRQIAQQDEELEQDEEPAA